MKALSCHITIGSVSFTWTNTITVSSSWELLTDTASIVLPANVKIDHNNLSKHVKEGDKVIVQLGYDNALKTVFNGYVTHIKPKVPVEISCEDEMWILKQSNITSSAKGQTVNGLLAAHFGEYESTAINAQLGNYYIKNKSRAKILESLKSDFGLYAFFREGKLVVGKRYDTTTATHHSFKLGFNIIEDDLTFKRKDQVKLKVKAISNNPVGSKTEVELGDPDGELRTLNFYDMTTSELRAAASREMERLKYDGWRGSFTAFGEPMVKHGDIVQLTSDKDSDKTGSYWVDAVDTVFGTDGFRQSIKLGARL